MANGESPYDVYSVSDFSHSATSAQEPRPFRLAGHGQTTQFSMGGDYLSNTSAAFPPSSMNQFAPTSPESMASSYSMHAADMYAGQSRRCSDNQPSGGLAPSQMSRTASQRGINSSGGLLDASRGAGYHKNDINMPATPYWMSPPTQQQMSYKTRGGTKVVSPTSSYSFHYRHAPSSTSASGSRLGVEQTFSEPPMPMTPRSDPEIMSSPGSVYPPATDMASDMNAMHFGAPPYPSPFSTAHGPPKSKQDQPQAAKSEKKKDFNCEVSDCTHNKAFGTKNDLWRHMFSVHRIAAEGQKAWVCQGESCQRARKTKEWPRKDNFKSHCKVAHPNEEIDDLLQRSEKTSRPHPRAHREQSVDACREDSPASLCMPPQSLHRDRNPSPFRPLAVPGDFSPLQVARSPHVSVVPPSSMSPTRTMKRSLSQLDDGAEEGQDAPNGPTAQPLRSADWKKKLASLSMSDKLNPEERLVIEELAKKISQDDISSADEDTRRQYNCGDCPKTFGRKCDLRKHTERHKKRWGCTNDSCSKTFGSKNDWKRHENLVHFQREIWVCGEQRNLVVDSKQRRCTFVTESREDFREHLKSCHKKLEDYVKEQEKVRRVGRQCAGSMWCGFCQKVLQLKKLDLEQREERFDHIDTHFKEGKKIQDWYPPHSDLPKGRMLAESALESHVVEATGSATDMWVNTRLTTERRDFLNCIPIDPVLTGASSMPTLPAPSRLEYPPRKRQATTSVNMMPSVRWICCHCQSAIMNWAIEDTCFNCNHGRLNCEGCERSMLTHVANDAKKMQAEVDESLNPLLRDRSL